MKNWFHSHRIRKSRSEAHLHKKINHPDTDSIEPPTGPLPPLPHHFQKYAAKLGASRTSNRMSIERYLCAPLEDEPASVPAIDAALKRHNSKSRLLRTPSNTTLRKIRAPREDSSFDDVHSEEGRRTVYTYASSRSSASGTSYSGVSKTGRHHHRHHQRRLTDLLPEVPALPRLEERGSASVNVVLQSPVRPTMAGAGMGMGMGIGRGAGMGEIGLGIELGVEKDAKFDYKAKAEIEIARIREKAKILEEQMRRQKSELEVHSDPSMSRVTNEEAYEMMAEQPKLAWILGSDATNAQSIRHPKSRAVSVAVSTINDYNNRPGTSGTLEGSSHTQTIISPKAIPISTLDEAQKETIEQRGTTTASVEQMPNKLKRLRFYCTFCRKRFYSRTDWEKHEQTTHMPEELWVCCPRTGVFPERCPFCTKKSPSPSHLADHNYLSCQAKPLSERTFSCADLFLQHIGQEHKISPAQEKRVRSELLETWKNPIPLKQGHRALHCGFCGKMFANYSQRMEHVAGHFFKGGLDMLSWWEGRIDHEVEGPEFFERRQRLGDPTKPHKCMYCNRTYATLDLAQSLHPTCKQYSCSFLPGIHYTIYPSGTPGSLKTICCYCDSTLSKGDGRIKSAALKEHMGQEHHFRRCGQRLYFSAQRFRQHLRQGHGAEHDGTLWAGWTLLVRECERARESSFEAVDMSTSVRRAHTEPDYYNPDMVSVGLDSRISTQKEKEKEKKKNRKKYTMDSSSYPPVPKMNFMDLSGEMPPPPNKLRRKASAQTVYGGYGGYGDQQPLLPKNIQPMSKEEMRDSGTLFTRPNTPELAYPSTPSTICPSRPHSRSRSSNPPRTSTSSQHGHIHRPRYPNTSPSLSTLSSTCPPRFYRRNLDDSGRNRIYVYARGDGEAELSKSYQKAFRRVEGGVVGSLILYSSLVGGVPARLTNGVDVYCLR